MSAFEILLPLALILSLTKLLGLGSQKVGLARGHRYADRRTFDRTSQKHPLRCNRLYFLFRGHQRMAERLCKSRRGAHHVLDGSGHGSQTTEIDRLFLRRHHDVRRPGPHGAGHFGGMGVRGRGRIFRPSLLRGNPDRHFRFRHGRCTQRAWETQYESGHIHRRGGRSSTTSSASSSFPFLRVSPHKAEEAQALRPFCPNGGKTRRGGWYV